MSDIWVAVDHFAAIATIATLPVAAVPAVVLYRDMFKNMWGRETAIGALLSIAVVTYGIDVADRLGLLPRAEVAAPRVTNPIELSANQVQALDGVLARQRDGQFPLKVYGFPGINESIKMQFGLIQMFQRHGYEATPPDFDYAVRPHACGLYIVVSEIRGTDNPPIQARVLRDIFREAGVNFIFTTESSLRGDQVGIKVEEPTARCI